MSNGNPPGGPLADDARTASTQLLTRELGKRELETIIMVSTLLNTGQLRMQRILEVSMQAITDALDAEAGAIFLLDERTDELEIFVPTGTKGHRIRGMRVPHRQGLVGWVVEHGNPLLIEDAAQDERFGGEVDEQSGFTTKSVLAVPLKVRSKVIGALEVLNKRDGGSFHSSEVPFTRALANQVAIALENARLYTALQSVFDETKRIQEVKSNFITVAAHELLTPLTIMSANVQILRTKAEGPDADPELVEAVAGVDNGLARLQRLSQDLTNMALIDEGRVQLDIGPVNMAELVEGVTSELSLLAERRDLQLAIEVVPDSYGFEVAGDVTRLRHVFQNLMMNAIRFTPDGGHIAVRTVAEADSVRVAVSDDGIGIAEEEHERIFDPLYGLGRVEHHRSGTYEFRSGGLGLGLAIARGIVEAHGGFVHVASRPGRGSTFSFRIPRHPPARNSAL